MRTYGHFSYNLFRIRNYKKQGGGREPLLVPELATHHVSLATILKFFLFTLLRTLLRSFARSQESSPFFSSDSALFCQKPPGGGADITRALRASRRGRGASAKPAFLSSSGAPPSNAAQSQVTVTFFACFNFPLPIEDLGLVGTVNLFSNLLHLPPQAGALEFQRTLMTPKTLYQKIWSSPLVHDHPGQPPITSIHT